MTDLGNEDLGVSVSEDELVVRATIDRPEKRNALNDNVILGLAEVLEAADEGPARVVVIRGAEGTFCSGGDLTGFPIGQGVMAYRENFGALAALIDIMQDTDALTVAAVEGYCLAGGLGLASACEFVLATEDATFGTPEVDVGLFPAQAMAPISRAGSEKAVLKLLFTGDRIDAAEAHRIGLTTDLVDPDEFDAELDEFVDTLANNSPALIAIGKESYYEQRDMDFPQALAYLKEIITMIALTDDFEEGINAFLTDSEPDWRRR